MQGANLHIQSSYEFSFLLKDTLTRTLEQPGLEHKLVFNSECLQHVWRGSLTTTYLIHTITLCVICYLVAVRGT